MSQYPIRTQSLGKTYQRWFSGRSVCALEDLTIEVPAGTIFGFLGPNGAGKTTTIKMILGMLQPSKGEVQLMDFSPMDERSRKSVGYMPELPYLYEHMDAVEFLSFMGGVSQMEPMRMKRRIEQVLGEVGLAGKEGVTVNEFSKGMKQRLELAQALLDEPKLLILDEPFSGLDPLGRKEVRDLIVRYNKEQGTTVFFSSHILTDTEAMCDWVGILSRGKLKALGMMDELLAVQSIEISGVNVRPEGILFLEKMGESTAKNKDRFSVFLGPMADTERVEQMFHKYGATEVQVKKHCSSLEEFFLQTIDEKVSE